MKWLNSNSLYFHCEAVLQRLIPCYNAQTQTIYNSIPVKLFFRDFQEWGNGSNPRTVDEQMNWPSRLYYFSCCFPVCKITWQCNNTGLLKSSHRVDILVYNPVYVGDTITVPNFFFFPQQNNPYCNFVCTLHKTSTALLGTLGNKRIECRTMCLKITPSSKLICSRTLK